MKFKTEAEREQFILNNINLAYKVASKIYYQDTCFDLDDVKQECVVGLIRAVDYFNESLGTNFSTYAYTAIYRHTIRYIQLTGYEYFYHTKKMGYIATNFSDINNVDGEPSVADEYVNEDTVYNPFYLDLESQDVVDTLLKQVKAETYFSDKTLNYLKLRLQGFTQVDIAKIYGVSRQAVSCSINSLLDYIYDYTNEVK